jgi:rod shape-determining protein MreC
MPLGTLDRTPPPFFKQGASAFSKFLLFGSLSIFLMVLDTRFKVTQPLRSVLSAAMFPLQQAIVQPKLLLQALGQYFEQLGSVQSERDQLISRLIRELQRSAQVEQLLLENQRLRALAELRERFVSASQVAQVLYDAADPYTRQVVIDKGTLQGITLGSPVLDESGVLGQVTRTYPATSEVTLVTDRDQSIPVLNTRTGARAVAFGTPGRSDPGLELRYMATNADVQPGDVLSTSGVDGVYPPGLPVARVDRIERRVDSSFARIVCTPLAKTEGSLHVLVVQPVTNQFPARTTQDEPIQKARKAKVQ